jgi:hypothetical protein
MDNGWFESEGGVLLPVESGLQVGGVFTIEHYRHGELIDVEECHNLIVDEGLNHILDVTLHGSTQVGTWYVGLFEGNYTPVAGLTAATVTASATECTAYDESTRVAYNEAAASSKVTTNSANKATFTFNATKTIYGAFLASASAKSATTGTLLAAARFGSSKAVADDDQLLVTYALSAASS